MTGRRVLLFQTFTARFWLGSELSHGIGVRTFAHYLGAHHQVAGYDLAELADLPVGAPNGDLVQYFLALNNPAKRGRVSVELRRRDQGDDKLATRLARPVLDGGNRAAEVRAGLGSAEFIGDHVARAADSVVRGIVILGVRIASHHHVPSLRPVERSAVVESRFNQTNEVSHRCRSLVFK